MYCVNQIMESIQADQIAAIFRRIFRIGSAIDVETISKENFPKWDSFGHLSLVYATEAEFGIKFTVSEILQLTSYRDYYRLVKKKAP